ncbi:MAG: histidine kinase [Candidatus Delongbacteria bacterium]|nr:histidine kinase [Candidatus Delongbacteria bacterium]
MSHKITFSLIVVSLGACLVLGFVVYYSMKEAMLERTYDQLISVRTEKQNRLEKFFADRKYDIRLMAEEETIVALMKGFQKEDRFKTDFDPIIIDKNTVPYHGNEYFSALLFLPSGSHGYAYSLPFNRANDSVLIKRVKEPEELHVFRGIKDTCQDPVLLDFSMKSRMHPGVRLGMPVYDDAGRRLGVLCSILPIESINEIMYKENPHNGLGESGEAYLVGSDYYMRSTSRFHDSAIMSTVVKTPGVEKALAGERGVDMFYDYRGVKVLSSYARLNLYGLDWVILAEIDFDEALIPIVNIKHRMLLIGLGVAVLVFVLAWVLSRMLTGPLIRLNRAVSCIAKGKNPPVLEVNSKDEIGELTAAFNNMANQIRVQKEKLRFESERSMQSMIDGQENERQRLSREIHDSLGQMLIALKLKYQAIHKGIIKTELLELIDQTIEESRRMSGDLKPAELEEFGLKPALQRLCDQQQAMSKLEIEIDIDALPEKMSEKLEIYLYRILQECLSNIYKHSDATKASVKMSRVYNRLIIDICDDGKGFDPRVLERADSYGLKNIQDRVSLLHGKVSIKSAPGKGTCIIIRINLLD